MADAIAVTSGEPAGIGPDLCLTLGLRDRALPLVVLGDIGLLGERAQALGLAVEALPYGGPGSEVARGAGSLTVLHCPTPARAFPGRLDPANAPYVLTMLERAGRGCLDGEFAAVVTAPVQKSVINDAGIAFTGHTEYFAELTNAPLPVMMLAAGDLRVALVTTHLPLRAVPDAITAERLETVCRILNDDLARRLNLARPRILVCGLNPHAGESGHLGREEIEVITPVLERLRGEGMDLVGPLPADTLFTPRVLEGADAVLSMYHDQGLPVLKHAGFGRAVNITLGLPIVRTSVDHGTALDLAGTGRADAGSLEAAVAAAAEFASVPSSR